MSRDIPLIILRLKLTHVSERMLLIVFLLTHTSHLSLPKIPTVAAAAAAMVSVPAMMVFVAGGICCLNSPTVVHNHFSISSLPSKLSITFSLFF